MVTEFLHLAHARGEASSQRKNRMTEEKSERVNWITDQNPSARRLAQRGLSCAVAGLGYGSTTMTWNEPGLGCMRTRWPFAAGALSISAAERKMRFVFGSNAIVLALGCV